jgi:DNA polymerase I-like protein with 3'-5' exonuclease and polymerase domains
MTNVNQAADRTGVSVTYSEAKRLINLYREVHPFLAKWWKEVEAELWKSRTLYNLLGRRRIFYGHIRSIVPNAVAFVPQSTVGDVLNIGLLSLHNVKSQYLSTAVWDEYATSAVALQSTGFQLLNQIHDAVGYQYPVAERDQVNELVEKLLSVELTVPPTYQTVRIPVEIQVGPSWGDLSVWRKA